MFAHESMKLKTRVLEASDKNSLETVVSKTGVSLGDCCVH